MKEKKEKLKNSHKENDNQKNDKENIETDVETNLEISEHDQTEDSSKTISKEEELSEEILLLKEEKIRLLAEMENIRKRFEREKIDSIKYGSLNLARDILSPGDNIERALTAIPQNEEHPQSIKNLIDGLKMVQKEFTTILEKNGITRIESLDTKFDPELHQAMVEIEKKDVDEGTVVQEMQAGYRMHERLLRPAMVGVSKKPSAKQDEEKTKAENEEKNLKNKDK